MTTTLSIGTRIKTSPRGELCSSELTWDPWAYDGARAPQYGAGASQWDTIPASSPVQHAIPERYQQMRAEELERRIAAAKAALGTRLVIPTEAVLESGERQIVFIHHGGGVLEWRAVKLGARAGDWVEVVGGLAEGDHVVTSANFLIDSESRLKSAVGSMQGMQH